MDNFTWTQSTTLDRTIAGLLVASVTFILGYTVVRATLAQTAAQGAVQSASVVTENVDLTVPSEGALWADTAMPY